MLGNNDMAGAKIREGCYIIMNNMKISTIGSSLPVAIELYQVIEIFFNDQVEICNKYDIRQLSEQLPIHLPEDLFIVLPTRVEQACKYVPRKKVMGIELVEIDTSILQIAERSQTDSLSSQAIDQALEEIGATSQKLLEQYNRLCHN